MSANQQFPKDLVTLTEEVLLMENLAVQFMNDSYHGYIIHAKA